MALVSGRGSTLNPNAPPFIPAVYRQVEDFSSEWWNLVQNSAWFRDHWMSEHKETSFEGVADSKDDDITNLLPETFDVGYDEFAGVEADFEEMIEFYEAYDRSAFRTVAKPQNGQGLDAAALMANLDLSSSPMGRGPALISMMEPARYNERSVQYMSPTHGPRRIHQPR